MAGYSADDPGVLVQSVDKQNQTVAVLLGMLGRPPQPDQELSLGPALKLAVVQVFTQLPLHGGEEGSAVGISAVAMGDEEGEHAHTRWWLQRELGHQRRLARPRLGQPPPVGTFTLWRLKGLGAECSHRGQLLRTALEALCGEFTNLQKVSGARYRRLSPYPHKSGRHAPVTIQQFDEGRVCGELADWQRVQAAVLVLLVVLQNDAHEVALTEDRCPGDPAPRLPLVRPQTWGGILVKGVQVMPAFAPSQGESMPRRCSTRRCPSVALV